jgi:hypothetical protein
VQVAKGQPSNPLTDAELAAKFRGCAARVLPEDRAEAVASAVGRLEAIPDVSALAALLAAPAR